MGTGPPRLRRRLIVVLALHATAGLTVAPASQADPGVAVDPSPASTAIAAVETVVPVAVEPPVALVESLTAPAADLEASAEATRSEVADVVGSAAPAIASAAADVAAKVSSATGTAPAISPLPRPRAAVSSARRGPASPPAPASPAAPDRPERAALVEPSSGIPSVGRAIPLSTGAERHVAWRAPDPQPFPGPSEPAGSSYGSGFAPAFSLVFLATVLALFLARSGLGTRISPRLAKPPGAALALELERPG